MHKWAILDQIHPLESNQQSIDKNIFLNLLILSNFMFFFLIVILKMTKIKMYTLLHLKDYFGLGLTFLKSSESLEFILGIRNEAFLAIEFLIYR